MAKSSLDFIDRLRVNTLTESRNVTLTKDDCGKVFVLNSALGHTILLPTAASAGPGWHAQFVVQTNQSDLTERAFSSVAAQGSDTLLLQRFKAAAGAVSTVNNANEIKQFLQFNAGGPEGPAGVGDTFTVQVGAAAGGSNTQFTFELVDAAGLAAATATADKFFVQDDADESVTATRVKAALEGVANDFVKPPGGEGSVGKPVEGRFSLSVVGNNLRITMSVDGTAAPAAILIADGAGDPGDGNIATAANVGAVAAAAGDRDGQAQTSFVLDTRTIQIQPSGVAQGDRISVELVNGVWHARSESTD